MSREKLKGTLVGLAVGDVLGTPFEFWKGEEVKST
jgi:ADP-ribosylglycohydrolase